MNKTPIYRIVQYPDRSFKSGLVFFVDRQVEKKYLWLFKRTVWESVKYTSGNSMYWNNFDYCKRDVEKLKRGEKVYQ